MRTGVAVVIVVAFGLGGVRLFAQPAEQPLGQPSLEGFVAEEDLEGVERIPAAPLVLTAYGFVWVAVLFYVWLTWRRLSRVEADLQQLAARTKKNET